VNPRHVDRYKINSNPIRASLFLEDLGGTGYQPVSAGYQPAEECARTEHDSVPGRNQEWQRTNCRRTPGAGCPRERAGSPFHPEFCGAERRAPAKKSPSPLCEKFRRKQLTHPALYAKNFADMSRNPHSELSRRERQIMDVIYQRGQASAAEVLEALPDPPSYSTVRTLLRILEEKGHLKHKEEGLKYIFLPIRARGNAGRQALQRIMRTFYDGSVEKAVMAMLDASEKKLSPEEIERLQSLIEQTKKEGR
jgi:BlaI family transcriptional regulator, penicillinase repressor